jgi:hypothetical protein
MNVVSGTRITNGALSSIGKAPPAAMGVKVVAA